MRKKAKEEPKVPTSQTTRVTEYTLSPEEAIEAAIQYLRQRGFHAPDQTKAKYKLHLWDYHAYRDHEYGRLDIKWTERIE